MEGATPLFQLELPFGYSNSQHLLPAIETGLDQLKITIDQLSLIAVGIGPGSYTGIRVGAMVGKALAFPHHVPLVGICTLHTFVPNGMGDFAAVIDAKIGGAYLVKGNKRNSEIHYHTQPMVCPLEEVAKQLQDVSVIVTPNQKRLQPLLDAESSMWEWQEKAPCAHHMTALALQKFHSGCYSTNGHLDLLYMRKTQAEIEKSL